MTIAHIYIRFSTDEQAEGSSIARQKADCLRRIQAEGWQLGEIIIDAGLSAFSGANRSEGAGLRAFELEALNATRLGQVLVVERLDRLSRQGFDPIRSLIGGLTENGVGVAIANPGYFYPAGGQLDLSQMMSLLMFAELAKAESTQKAKRVKAGFADKWRKLRERGGVLGQKQGPAWLKVVGDRYEPIADRVALVRRMFKMADEGGHGGYTIARVLNAEGVKTWQRFANRRSELWTESRVNKILADPSVLGEFQPHERVAGKRVPVGQPISLFPAIIETSLFQRVQDASAARLATKGGGKSEVIANLVSGLAKCDHCGGLMRYSVTRKAGAQYRVRGKTYSLNNDDAHLVCRSYQLNSGCDNGARIAYHSFEKALVEATLHIAMDDSAFVDAGELGGLNRQLAELDRQREQAANKAKNLWAAFSENGSQMAMQLAKDAEDQARDIESQASSVRQLRDKAAGKATDAEHLSRIAKIKGGLYDSSNPDRLAERKRVMVALRSVISYIWCDRDKIVTVAFAGGLAAIKIQRGKIIDQANAVHIFEDGNFSGLGNAAVQRQAKAVAERITRQKNG